MTKRKFLRLTFVVLAVCWTTKSSDAYRNVQPEEVSFRRDNVEAVPPRILEKTAAYTQDDVFGTRSLPLRSAVESTPVNLVDERVPLRDAVEFRILDMDDAIEDVISEVKSVVSSEKERYESGESFEYRAPELPYFRNKYAAYQFPSHYDTSKPQPFRYGSPYQQLVDISTLKQIPQVEYNQVQKVAELKQAPSDLKVICHMTNWAFYRKDDAQFVPEHIDNKLCTHIIYSFASLDQHTLTMKEFDTWSDIENNLYQRTIAAGGSNVPVLLGIGGWTDSVGSKYSNMVSSPQRRSNFIESAVVFLKTHGFSGLHLDWNYPVCWQSDCSKGPSSDRPNLTKLIMEMKREFAKKDLLVSMSISGYKEVLTEAYEIAQLSKTVDFMTVMTYDYHGSWESQTGHVSPLYGASGDKYPQYHVDYAMQLLVKMGAQKDKLVMGVPLYGQTFTLRNKPTSDTPGVGTPASGPGHAGEDTKQPGMLAYFEICQRVRKSKWKVGRDSALKSGPYATMKDQWVGYDDPVSATVKAKYVMKAGYGGIAAWTIDLDDFQNKCCEERYPVLSAINRAFGRLKTSQPTVVDCTRPIQPVTPPPAVMTVPVDGGLATTSATTWPSWQESSTTRKPTTTSTTTTTTTRRPTTTTHRTTTTTRRTTTSTRRTTTPTPTTTTTTTTTYAPQTTTVGTTIPVPGLVQPELEEGDACEPNQYKAHPSSCNSYYRCVYGQFKQQFCAGGLHWNEAAMLCDWPSSAKCTKESNPQEMEEIPPTTSMAPTTTRRRTSTKTTAYTTRTTRSTTTPPRVQATQRPMKKPTTTTKKPVTTTKKPDQRPVEKCTNGEYYPHKSCDSFYICVNEKKVAQQCGPGLLWNHDDKSCDWEDNVNCVSRAQYYKLLAKYSRLAPYKVLSEDDPCDGHNYVPYPGDCTQYLICNWGRLEAASCADGLQWNQQQMICDWPANAKCEQSSSPESTENSSEEVGSLQEVDQEIDRPASKPTTTTTTTSTTTTTEAPVLEPLSGYYNMICYFTNWAWYRKGYGKYTPDHIRTDLCTHIVYGFAVLDYSTLTIKTHDSWADIDNKFYTRVVAAKEKGAKVTLAIGGWNDSAGDKYSRLVRSAAARARFIQHVVGFLEKYGFDGLDLDWEYPVCWQVDCKKGYPDEKEGFASLVRELSAEFKPRGWLLSAAVSPSKTVIDAGYDVPVLAKYFDWIAVMTYDYHGQWDKQTGHVAPLYYHPQDEIDFFNANYTINYWIQNGAPSRKLVMGMPLYGQSFTLADPKNNGLNAKAPGPGQAGEFTRAAGFIAYYEICDRIQNKGWTVVQDELQRMGPYAYKGNQWVSFDDKESLLRKVQYIRAMNLGGGMIWALDLDDFKNRCGQGHHPLLTAIRNGLIDPPSGAESLPPIVAEQGGSQEPVSPNSISSASNSNNGNDIQHPSTGGTDQDENAIDSDETYKVVCYFTNWAWYRQDKGKYLPEDIDADLCTHIVYGFAVLDRQNLVIKPHDSWADIDNRFYERVVELKRKGKKVTVAIGGWNDSAGDKYSRLVRNANARSKFIANVMAFIEKYGFDGLDLDWEYPVCWQVDCTKGYPDEKEGFASLVIELSEAFKPKGLLLSSAVSPSKKVIDAGYDVVAMSSYMDWIAVMAYDYHGQWDKKTGHVAPMYEHPDDFDKTFNANFTLHYWIEKGADPRKLVMGMPMYGQSFSLADNNKHDLNARTYGGGEAGDYTRARGFLSYYEICNNIREKKWTVVRDRKGRMGPYAYKGDQWVSFDDQYMIRHKSEYVKAMGLGGAMIWALDLDDFRNLCDCEEYPLLKTINRVLRNYPGPGPRCVLEKDPHREKPKPTKTPTPSTRETTRRPTTTTTRLTTTTRKPTTTTRWRTSTRSTQGTTEAYEETIEHVNNQQSCTDGRLFAPHPTDCNKYYICQHHKLYEQSCPEGLFWSGDYCDWPQNTNCQAQEPSVPSTTRRPSRPTTRRTTTTAVLSTRKTTTWWAPETSSRGPPTTTTHPEVQLTENGDYIVVCYFTNWAWYRQGDGKYTPDDIDDTMCTHIVYGFAVLDRESLTIKTHDSWADIDNRFYERVVEHKRKGTKVTLALGGWNDSLGDKYSKLVRDPSARLRFVKHAVEFIEKYNFDGLDLDWEYPVCWQVDCKKGYPDEKEGFADLVKELAIEFRPRGWLLSAAVSPSKMVIDAGYDVPVLAEYFDYIAVMTYDFHGHWDKETGHVAPLYYYPGDKHDVFNANYSINYWIEKGAPSRKLVMGMPLYGQSFSLADTSEHGLRTKSYGPGEAGQFTRAGGFLAYYEICEKVNQNGWTVERDQKGRIGPYAYRGNQWVSYDDVDEIRRKSRFIKEMNLGGGMVWALDLDDFRGRCGCGKHPLLRTMNQELGRISTKRPENCT
ncbi:probable chitinase 10 [Toxorhynchites rutilus septentrionalis]|uniref:probable chitinase 10 n=1 Tax=Toxorhynchites rutilus septentrionalis TaxID=329112 RepID=UPI00247ACFFA|nr:probable chitinase 10 [Toxorhynchites rutilus septentrionalis]XP_055636578.1 probable chitinase 10 [Toxorhynchites rutilus septentrionalis]XP_055636579.1 probable chitinase 10 [Toxorhynchites rutilus septentrionalis]